MTEPTRPAPAGHTPTPDEAAMDLALRAAAAVRPFTSPNPWVGAVVVDPSGDVVASGATEPPGGRHAEVVALDSAGERAAGATLVCTLEPCAHHGRTPPCAERIIESGVRRVVVGVGDPDPQVAGRGVEALRSAGIEVIEGVRAHEVTAQLAAYLHHRRTGRPYVLCKLAASLDGRTAAVDGSSRWITGEAARIDVHRLRSESDAIVVGAGTVRADDPELTVRHVEGRDPRRIVLGTAPPGAKVHPCLEWDGPLPELLDQLGAAGVLQVLVEGGATVARSFHEADLVDRFVVYLAPALFGGRDGAPLIGGATAATIDGVWRGRFGAIDRLGDDLRIELFPVERDRVDEHGLLPVSIAEPIRHRRSTEMLVERTATARVPTEWGDFRCHSFTSTIDGETHLAFAMGQVAGDEPVLVRVHSECITGDVFGSVKCDCGPQLREAMRLVAAAGRGVVVYLRGHEGRGIGISHKLRAYELQDRGLDTVDANVELGLPIDRREYAIGAQILVDLGVRRMRLLTNNPAKYGGLEGFGLSIEERIPLHLPAHPEAVGYLRAKRDRMGHLLPDELGLPADPGPA